ncbi:MAG: ATP synthase F1 subunit epsilon, partial [Rhodobacteraceae bacterium]|nr:ATP synthase F1 subunit epsilon [Paracoccaceae bacterium]
MADTLQFELVSPERKLVSVAATQIQIPGMSGDFTAMPNHAPYLTTLRPGVVRVVAGGETTEYLVTGGFAEVSPEAATILAEQAAPLDAASREMLADLVAASE